MNGRTRLRESCPVIGQLKWLRSVASLCVATIPFRPYATVDCIAGLNDKNVAQCSHGFTPAHADAQI